MRSVIEKLENRIQNTEGLTVLENRDDGFTYSIALQKDGETYVVYTTRTIHSFLKEACLGSWKVIEHLPFEEVTPTVNGDFLTPYKKAITSKDFWLTKDYGLTVDELPVFQ